MVKKWSENVICLEEKVALSTGRRCSYRSLLLSRQLSFVSASEVNQKDEVFPWDACGRPR